MATTETRKMVLAAAGVCDEKKAENTRVLELDPADSGFTDFFLITSGTNTRQTVAIADDIELKMKREFGAYANSVEGRRTGEWILMDYVDFVVHIFVEEKRAFYDIERLRKSARSVDLPQLKAALTEKTAAARKTHPVPAEKLSPAATEFGTADAAVSEEAGAGTATPAKKAATAGKKTAAPAATARKATAKKSLAKKSAARKTAAKSTARPAKKSATRMAAAAAASSKRAAPSKTAAKKAAKLPSENSKP